MLQGLYRRSSGIYAVRITVPKKLRHLVGKCEIHVTTGLRDLKPATVCALKIQLQWQEKLMAMDIEQLRAGSPALLISGKIPLNEACLHLGLEIHSLLSICNDRYTRLYSNCIGVAGWAVNSLDGIERDYDGSFITNDVERLGIQTFHSGEFQIYDTRMSVEKLLESGSASESVLKTHGGGGFFPDHFVEVTLSSIKLERKDVEAIRQFLLTGLPSVTTSPSIIPSVPSNVVRKGKHEETSFSELFNTYKRDRKFSADNLRKLTYEFSLFTDLMGDQKLTDINKALILDFADRLAQVPQRVHLIKKKYSTNNAAEMVEIAKRENLPTKEIHTVKRHILKISEILKYGLDNGMLPYNPAANYLKGKGKIFHGKAQNQREIFTANDLSMIFSLPWFCDGHGKFNKNGSTNWRPHYYWLPILGLLTGARLNELSQLYISDIHQIEKSNSWYIHITKNDSTGSIANDKALKNENSDRVIPLHNVILSLGFIEYINALKMANHTRLFPELRYDPIKGYSKAVSSWFNERLLGKQLQMARDGRKCFHSFRHTFLTELEGLDVTSTVLGQLAGHVKGDTEAANRYAKNRAASGLIGFIERIQYDCLASIKPFNSAMGMRALKHSLKLKQRNVKRMKAAST